jgi:hypothetical protein
MPWFIIIYKNAHALSYVKKRGFIKTVLVQNPIYKNAHTPIILPPQYISERSLLSSKSTFLFSQLRDQNLPVPVPLRFTSNRLNLREMSGSNLPIQIQGGQQFDSLVTCYLLGSK